MFTWGLSGFICGREMGPVLTQRAGKDGNGDGAYGAGNGRAGVVAEEDDTRPSAAWIEGWRAPMGGDDRLVVDIYWRRIIPCNVYLECAACYYHADALSWLKTWSTSFRKRPKIWRVN